ncbi:uncharacterized protein LOC108098150 [Drosophila ficusphila]|uniref:uncharacterized protein LOC108098150 n=1 Tax=Drosophila ficusphila TaxID=30025 RepID=UPI0007E61C00|nr:uncharacterized protein LOC108098150 [Drosophila ficusphila]
MQRSVIKSGCSRTLTLLNPLRSFHQKGLYVDESLEAPVAKKTNCLELLGRLLHGRLNLLSGRPVPPRFLPFLTGESNVYFNADENEEFRRRLGMQLKELRETLQVNRENRQRQQEQDLEEDLREEEHQPYTTSSQEITVEDLAEEELDESRAVRMSASEDGEKSGGSKKTAETSEGEGEETAEAREPQDPQDDVLDVHERMRDGEIEGVYWTGEGKRIVTQTPQRKTGHSGFVDGDGEEIHVEETPGQPLPYYPEGPRAKATSKVLKKGRKPGTKPTSSDE